MVHSSSWETINRHQVKKYPHFMGPEGSLPCSQEPTTCLSLRQINLVYALQTDFLKIRSNIILRSTPRYRILIPARFNLAKNAFRCLESPPARPAPCSVVQSWEEANTHSTSLMFYSTVPWRNCRPLTCNLSDFSTTVLSLLYIYHKNLLARRQPQIELRMFIIVLSVIKNLRNRINQNL